VEVEWNRGKNERRNEESRTGPFVRAASHLLLALSGRRGYRVAGHTGRRFVDALAALGPDSEATTAW
jgi:hypothetical protein